MANLTAPANSSSLKSLDFLSPIAILPANPFPHIPTSGSNEDVFNVSLERLQVYTRIQESFRGLFDILNQLVEEV